MGQSSLQGGEGETVYPIAEPESLPELRGPIICAYRENGYQAVIAMAAGIASAHNVQLAAIGVAKPLPLAAALFLNASRNVLERERRETVLGVGLDALREQLPNEPELWGVYATAGRFAPTVMRYARSFGSDLIVAPAQTLESGRVEHLAARGLLAAAWQPVLSMPDVPAIAPPSRALVGVDFAPSCTVLVQATVATMSPEQCTVVLVHVAPGESAEWSEQWQREYAATASRYMEEWLTDLQLPEHVQVESMVVMDGTPSVRLRELAAEMQCDMLAIGSTGEGAALSVEGGRPVGEVADRLLHDCTMPLLVVPDLAEPLQPERSGTLELGADAVPGLARILVPVDGSQASEQAVPSALSVARRTGAEVKLVYVEDELSPGSEPESYPQDVLRDYETRGVSVEARVLTGSPADAVLAASSEMGADLLVLTSRGRGGVKRALLGSTADRIIRRSEVPVLLVRGGGEGAGVVAGSVGAGAVAGSVGAGGDLRSNVAGDTGNGSTATTARDLGKYRKVLIPLDGSEAAEGIIPIALAVAGTDGVHYEVIRARPAPVDPALPASVPIIGRSSVQEDDGYLGSVAARMAEFGALVSVVTDSGRGRSVPQAIVRRVAAADIDLVAMTTRGLGGIDRMLFGSVADHVLRYAPCSVLVLRPAEVDHPGIHAGASVLPAPR